MDTTMVVEHFPLTPFEDVTEQVVGLTFPYRRDAVEALKLTLRNLSIPLGQQAGGWLAWAQCWFVRPLALPLLQDRWWPGHITFVSLAQAPADVRERVAKHREEALRENAERAAAAQRRRAQAEEGATSPPPDLHAACRAREDEAYQRGLRQGKAAAPRPVAFDQGLLMEILKLVHPDKQPPERFKTANAVTAKLLSMRQ